MMRCCDCEFQVNCNEREPDTVVFQFCGIRKSFLAGKANNLEKRRSQRKERGTMHCNAEKLAHIENELTEMSLVGIYPDWKARIIYLHFRSIAKGTKIVAIKNNFYAGMEILQKANERSE